jgi:hypothetical protein
MAAVRWFSKDSWLKAVQHWPQDSHEAKIGRK